MDAKQYSALGLDAPHHTKTDGTITENGYAPGEPNTGGMKNINNPEHTQSKNQPYELTEEATVREPGAPQGKTTQMPPLPESKIFPGTTRDWWVYEPAQYDKTKPANLLLCFDGGGAVLQQQENGPTGGDPTLLDNLHAKGAIPVTIVVGITPGRNPDYPEQRSHEYDTVSDVNATFLATEVLPIVEKQWNISSDPSRRCSLGGSSGGIGAFSVAWFRPDLFGNVICWVGSFVNIRGGHNYPWMVRNTKRKPIRAYLSDGANDLNNQHGSWPLANQEMHAALDYAGYDNHFDFGEGNHGSGAHLLPEMLRWVWGSQAAKL